MKAYIIALLCIAVVGCQDCPDNKPAPTIPAPIIPATGKCYWTFPWESTERSGPWMTYLYCCPKVNGETQCFSMPSPDKQ
jgi:hypothetical protein